MNTDCLHDRDLILLHYDETPERTTPAAAAEHLAACPACRARQERLAADLARIPAMADPDPVVATRIAARVNERLSAKRNRFRVPMMGGATVAALVLVVTLTKWSWHDAGEQRRPIEPATEATLVMEEDLPDIDFLEDLELIDNLELLLQIEGV